MDADFIDLNADQRRSIQIDKICVPFFSLRTFLLLFLTRILDAPTLAAGPHMRAAHVFGAFVAQSHPHNKFLGMERSQRRW